jgi:MFS family permease
MGMTRGKRRLAKARDRRYKQIARDRVLAERRAAELAAETLAAQQVAEVPAPAEMPSTSRRESLSFGMMISALILELISFVLFIVLWFTTSHDGAIKACGYAALFAAVLFVAAAIPLGAPMLRDVLARFLAGGGVAMGILAAGLTGWWWMVLAGPVIVVAGFWAAPYNEETS